MDLGSALSIASSGLNGIEYQYSVVSQNVANSSTTGYVSESASVTSAVANNQGTGVRIGQTVLNVSPYLQSSLYTQNAKVSALTASSNSLSAVSSVQGSTSADSGSTNTLSDALGNVQTALTSLTSTPLESSAQTAVITAATSLTDTIHTLASTYTAQRQTAEDTIVSTVSTINQNLTQIGQLSKQIMALKAVGSDTADLENSRLEVMNDLSSEIGVKFTETSKGDMVVTTEDGTKLPTRPDQIGLNDNTQTLPSNTWPLSATNGSTASTTITDNMYYDSSDPTNSAIAGITVADGTTSTSTTDITSHLTSGTLGANITLRDTTYPTMQAQLNAFSTTLINRFTAAGMSLFTSSSGSSVISTTATGSSSEQTNLASGITVNSTYSDTPSDLSPSGSTTTITSVLSTTFGTSSSDVSGSTTLSDGTVVSLDAPTSNLGPSGSLSTGYSATQGLVALATSLTSNQGATISTASTNLTYATAVQTTLSAKVTSVSGVDVNTEMSKIVALQNAYTANAKIISSVQTMFSALLDAIN
ncbi:MAG: flagellar basal body rod C-terminal domain-containing protein [Acetobacter okinawensis]|uniref:flagellar hook-associated protein FlgK n=1 Tax=Acetobacter okinawensis TaxID=1076594 RepID=UPI0039EC7C66